MDRDELKKIVFELLKKGVSLSDVQKELHAKHGEKMTFLNLRLLASELENFDWKEAGGEKEEKKSAKKSPSGKKSALKKDEEDENDFISSEKGEWQSSTVVEVNKLARPGVALSGTVKFASGVTAEWVLDQFGRLGLEKTTGKPTPEDLRGFQEELQRKVSGA